MRTSFKDWIVIIKDSIFKEPHKSVAEQTSCRVKNRLENCVIHQDVCDITTVSQNPRLCVLLSPQMQIVVIILIVSVSMGIGTYLDSTDGALICVEGYSRHVSCLRMTVGPWAP